MLTTHKLQGAGGVGGKLTMTLQQTNQSSQDSDFQVTLSQAQEGDLVVIVQSVAGWSSKNAFTFRAGDGFTWLSSGLKVSAYNSYWGTTLYGQLGISFRIVGAGQTTFTSLSYSNAYNDGSYASYLFRPSKPLSSATAADVSFENTSGTPTAQTITAASTSNAGIAIAAAMSGWSTPTVTLDGATSPVLSISSFTGFESNQIRSRAIPFNEEEGTNMSASTTDAGSYNSFITGYIHCTA